MRVKYNRPVLTGQRLSLQEQEYQRSMHQRSFNVPISLVREGNYQIELIMTPSSSSTSKSVQNRVFLKSRNELDPYSARVRVKNRIAVADAVDGGAKGAISGLYIKPEIVSKYSQRKSELLQGQRVAFVVSLTDKYGNPFPTSRVIDAKGTKTQTSNRISINDGVDWIELAQYRDVLFGQIVDEST